MMEMTWFANTPFADVKTNHAGLAIKNMSF